MCLLQTNYRHLDSMNLKLTYGIHPGLIWDHNRGLGSIIYVYNVAKATIMISNEAIFFFTKVQEIEVVWQNISDLKPRI